MPPRSTTRTATTRSATTRSATTRAAATGAPSAPDESVVRLRVREAARGEFAAHGLDAASVHTIAKSAGVTAAMINYYFGGKRALYDAVVEEAQGRLLARLAEAIGSTSKGGAPARLAGAYFDFLAEDGQLQRLLLRQILDRDDHVRERSALFVGPLRAFLEQHFGVGDPAVQGAISLFGAVAGYFLYEPVLAPFLGDDPLSEESLARRRAHVIRLATVLEKESRR